MLPSHIGSQRYSTIGLPLLPRVQCSRIIGEQRATSLPMGDEFRMNSWRSDLYDAE